MLCGRTLRASANSGTSCNSQMRRDPQRGQEVGTRGLSGVLAQVGIAAPRIGGSSREYLKNVITICKRHLGYTTEVLHRIHFFVSIKLHQRSRDISRDFRQFYLSVGVYC